jgi:hypothetical protein
VTIGIGERIQSSKALARLVSLGFTSLIVGNIGYNAKIGIMAQKGKKNRGHHYW